MLNFHHTPSGNIRLNWDEQSYFDSLDNFLLDYEGDYSVLPEGYREAQVEGERRAIYTSDSQEPMPDAMYSEILLILDAVETIIANKAAREAA